MASDVLSVYLLETYDFSPRAAPRLRPGTDSGGRCGTRTFASVPEIGSTVDARIEILAETALEANDLADASLPRDIKPGEEIVL